MNNRFVLGGKGYGLVSDVEVGGAHNLNLDFGCGGVLLEYVASSDRLLHLSIHSMIGAGGVRYAVKGYWDDHDDVNYDSDAFFVWEPGASLMLNIS